MRSPIAAVPLAFALAMAAEVEGQAVLDALAADQPVRPGVLSSLASVSGLASGGKTGAPEGGVRERLSQYYPRFYNCFSGQWRNC